LGRLRLSELSGVKHRGADLGNQLLVLSNFCSQQPEGSAPNDSIGHENQEQQNGDTGAKDHDCQNGRQQRDSASARQSERPMGYTESGCPKAQVAI
jgi:hypothetical protein